MVGLIAFLVKIKSAQSIYLCQNDDAKHGKKSNDNKERHAGAFP